MKSQPLCSISANKNDICFETILHRRQTANVGEDAAETWGGMHPQDRYHWLNLRFVLEVRYDLP